MELVSELILNISEVGLGRPRCRCEDNNTLDVKEEIGLNRLRVGIIGDPL